MALLKKILGAKTISQLMVVTSGLAVIGIAYIATQDPQVVWAFFPLGGMLMALKDPKDEDPFLPVREGVVALLGNLFIGVMVCVSRQSGYLWTAMLGVYFLMNLV